MYSTRDEACEVTLHGGLFSCRWLNVLPGMLLIAIVVLFFWLLGGTAIIGSGGSIEERAHHALPVAVERSASKAT
jgi:hypothetical protein